MGDYTTREITNEELLERLDPKIKAAQQDINRMCAKFRDELLAICDPVGIVFDMSIKLGVRKDCVPEEPQSRPVLH